MIQYGLFMIHGQRLIVSLLFCCVGWFLVTQALMASAYGADKQVANTSTVRVVQTTAGHELRRHDQPYFIRGAGGTGSLELLAQMGGNSVRTWGAESADQILDECHKLGLTVTLGIWLGHERHGFDYTNADSVAAQFDQARKIIEQYKDHPALLMWGIGNEMEGYAEGNNAAIWLAINQIAALAHELDPNHPTMTVLAEIGGNRVKNLHRFCPDIDVVGVNCYGGLSSLAQRYQAAGGIKPYVVTEFGPPGRWESATTPWKAPLELTSTEKARVARRGYEASISGASGLCLGSYAFVWGVKQEATATWFGLLLADGSRVALTDELQFLWKGNYPANRSPEIVSLKLSGEPSGKPGQTQKVTLETTDPEQDPLQIEWSLTAEVAEYSTGGDTEVAPTVMTGFITQTSPTTVTVRWPEGGGGYRLHAVVRDGQGGAATANLPLYVDAPIIDPPAARATLPLLISAEEGPQSYLPTGWMGDIKNLKAGPTKLVSHSGKECLQIDYLTTTGWGGIVWQHPSNDWGDRAGGYDLTGATRLEFWARGASGGERVKFELGLLRPGKRFFDSGHASLDNVVLTKDWQRYEIDLTGQDLTRIKTGFAVIMAAQEQPLTIYLDDLAYVGGEPLQPSAAPMTKSAASPAP